MSRTQLFSVPVSGGEATELTESLDRDSTIDVDYAFTSEPEEVIYKAGNNILRVPITGGDSRIISDQPLIRLQVNSSNTHVVGLRSSNIYSLPLNGGPEIKLNSDLRRNRRIQNFLISPDGQTVVYRGTLDNDANELFTVPISGGNPVKLSGGAAAVRGDVRGFKFSTDGNHIVYVSDERKDQSNELISVPSKGGSRVILHSVFPEVGGAALLNNFAELNSEVFYVRREGEGLDYRQYRVPITGGSASPIGDQFTALEVRQSVLSPDGSFFITATEEERDRWRLFSTNTKNGERVFLDSILDQERIYSRVMVSPDSLRVAFTVDLLSERDERVLYTVPISGGILSRVSGNVFAGGLADGNSPFPFSFSQDVSRLVFTGRPEDSSGRSGLSSLGVNSLFVRDSYTGFSSGFELTESFRGDDDGDGVSNVFEYMAGTDPTDSFVFPRELLSLERKEGKAILSVRMAQPGSNDLVISIESIDLLEDSDVEGWDLVSTRTSGIWDTRSQIRFDDEGIANIEIEDARRRTEKVLPLGGYSLELNPPS